MLQYKTVQIGQAMSLSGRGGGVFMAWVSYFDSILDFESRMLYLVWKNVK